MDTNVAGLNRVYCFTNNSDYNGKPVIITDGINTWTQTISSLSCVFMIPSMPAPAKRRYTVALMNSSDPSATEIYSRTIDLGFGDSVRIGLHENDENVTKGSVPLASSSRIGGFMTAEGTSNGIYLDGNYLKLKDATSSQKGGVVVPSGTSYGLYMDGESLKTKLATTGQLGSVKVGEGLQSNSSTGALSLKPATMSSIGGVIIGNGIGFNTSTGEINIAPAGTSSLSRGGVYVENNTGLTLNPSTGKLSLPTLSYGSEDITRSTVTVPANSFDWGNEIISSSSAMYSKLQRGFITGIEVLSQSQVHACIRGVSKSGSSYYLDWIAFNENQSSDKTFSKFRIYYAYFS